MTHLGKARRRTGGRDAWFVLVSTFALALAVAPPAFAIDQRTRSLLRQLSADGVTAYQEEDYPRALEKLDKAWSILPTAPLGLWSGRAFEKSGRWVDASERYLEATRAAVDSGGDRATQEAARQEAQAAYDAIKPRIPTIVVFIEGAEASDVTVTIAGNQILADFIGSPVPVDPGTVRIEARSPSETKSASVEVAEKGREEVTLTFAAAVASAPPARAADSTPAKDDGKRRRSWQPVAGWIGIGVGGAGIALGAVTGGIVLGKWSELDCGGPSNLCSTSDDEAAQLNDLRTVSTIGFIAGGVLAAAGVTLLLTAPKPEQGAMIRPYFTGDSAGITGTF